MAATATSTETTHDDSTSTSMAATEGFDELFVHPLDTGSHRGSLPTLPDGWQHAALVGRIARQPRERRETILAGLFALVAGAWAPLGILAFMTRNALLFFGLTALVAVLGAAPRPAPASQAVAALTHRLRPALERIGPALERVGPALAAGGARLRPIASRLGETRQRVAAGIRDGARKLRERLEPARARLRSADQRVSAVRRRLEGLRSGGPDHSSPSSAR